MIQNKTLNSVLFFFSFDVKSAHKTAAVNPISPLFTDVEDSPGDQEGRKDVVVIDSLFVMDQFKAVERVTVGRPHTRDIAEVTAMAEAVLPKGSARISPTVRRGAFREGLSGGPGASCFPTCSLALGAQVAGRGACWPFCSCHR